MMRWITWLLEDSARHVIGCRLTQCMRGFAMRVDDVAGDSCQTPPPKRSLATANMVKFVLFIAIM